MNNLQRICSGLIALKVEGETFLYSSPSPKTLYKADLLESEIIENNTLAMTNGESQQLLVKRGKWSEAKEREINEEIPKILEDLKIQLYVSYIREQTEIEKLKGKIQKVKSYLYKTLSQKHELDTYTIEGIAKRERTLFLLKKQVKGLKVKPHLLLNPYYSSILSESDIRKVARDEAWHVKWIALKNGCKVFSGHLTEEQERLIKWSVIYDNIAEAQEPPPEEVLNDDDALDGYFLYKRIEHKDKDKLAELEARYAQKGIKYTELYLPAKDMGEARRNDALNTEGARRLKDARFRKVNTEGIVEERNMPDQRMAIDIAKNNIS